jgi:hypothetical protein
MSFDIPQVTNAGVAFSGIKKAHRAYPYALLYFVARNYQN